MAWDYIGDGGQVADASGNFTLTEHASSASGDLLVACIAYRSNATITFPSGWTKIAATEQNSGNTDVGATTSIASCVMGYIIRGGSAPDLTFTRTGGDVAIGVVKSYRNTGTISVDDADSETAAAATTTPGTPSLTTTVANDLVVAMFAGGDNQSVVARFNAADLGESENDASEDNETVEPETAAWHLRESSNSTTGADTSLVVCDLVVGSATTTGRISVTGTATITNNRHAMAAVAFKAVSGYTLAADAGSYALTGTAASLEFGREVVAGAGSYALTGTAASLEYGREVVAGAGSYVLSGTDASLLAAPAADWFVATDGDDGNTGTSPSDPFATWQKAFDVVSAGETIAIRGGTYALDVGHTFKLADYAMLATATAGSSGNPINVIGWDGRPVLDFSAVAGITYGWGLLADASWWNFEGLDFTGLQQGVGDFMLTVGCEAGTTTNQNWTNCRAYGNAGPGFYHFGCTNVVVTDCDAYENWDVQDGGNADGFAFVDAGTGNKWINCRSFDNSDDGFDCWDTDNRVEIEGCWAFRNGWEPGTSNTAGDGNGFKLGQNTAGTRHLVTRCLAFNNRQSGFEENTSGGVHTLYNNAAGSNGLFNYSFTASVAHVLTNNLSYDGTNSIHATVVETTNSWQIGEPAPSIDFNSVSTAAADDARGSDGSLPSFTYLTHTDDSIFVDRGTDVGLAYQEAAPDIGWVESAFTQVPLPATWDYIGDGGQVVDATGNFDLVEPAGVASGDLLVACIAYRSNATISFPAGWTKVAATEQNSGNTDVDASTNIGSCVMGYIIRGGSAPDLTFTRTAGDVAIGVIKAYRASSGSISVDDADSNTEASATTNPDCPSLTATTRGNLLVAMLGGADNFAVVPRYVAASLDAAESGGAEVGSGTDPGSDAWRLRESSNSTTGADVHLSVADTVIAAPGTTGAISITSTTTIPNARHAMAAIAFKAVGVLLAAGAGSYALTGSDASLEFGREVVAGGGSYALSGVDVSLELGREVVAGAGSYALTGAAALLEFGYEVVAGGGSYALSGSDVTLTIESAGIILVADSGAYDLTGGAASLEFGYEVVAGGGSYALTGSAATLARALPLTAAGGSYALTGVPAGLELGRAVIAASGSYLLVGKQAALVAPGDPSFGHVRYWNGTEWIAAVLKSWNGSEWV